MRRGAAATLSPPMPDPDHLPKAALDFLADLARHNDRAWFTANKALCESDLIEPCRALVRTLCAKLQRDFPDVTGSDAKVGGSLTRLQRDTRFAKDGKPYHSHLGMHFWHASGKKMQVPGFFLRVDPQEVLVATGMHGPEPEPLRRIREAIDGDQKGWKRATQSAEFVRQWQGLEGETLKRVPAPWPADHPLADDLRRKDFTAFARLPAAQATKAGFADAVVERWRASKPLMTFLCQALA